MNDKPTPDELREKVWRGRLSEAERLRAARQPEWRAELELEGHLNELLAQLPTVPVSSNFTARVLQAIDREEVRPPGFAWGRSWLRWLPRMAVTTALVALATISWQQHELTRQRTAIAESIAQVAQTSSLPGVEALNNYDAIRRMGQPQHADEALLALMQ